MPGWFFVVMWVLSVVFSGLVGVALITYVRRTWQLIRADQDGSVHHRILEGVDEIQMRMDLLAERLERLEGGALANPANPGLLSPPEGSSRSAGDDPSPDESASPSGESEAS